MSAYSKKVEVLCNGLVCATVYRDGEQIGMKFFSPLIPTVRAMERAGDNALDWATRYISMADRIEAS